MYGEAGTLLLASRMKRLGDRLFSEITRAYKNLDIPFEPSWFPIFYLLHRDHVHSVSSMAREMGVTDSAVSQLVRQLKDRDLIGIAANSDDRRAGTICLSKNGEKLLTQVKPVWQAIESTLEETLISGRYGSSLLYAMSELERAIDASDLSHQINSRVELFRLEESYSISSELGCFDAWIDDLLLSFTIKPHPSWPQNALILAGHNGLAAKSIHKTLLLDDKQPIALILSTRDGNDKPVEHIRFCASKTQPAAPVEDFFLLRYSQSRHHPTIISAHHADKGFLYRLKKIGFILYSPQKDNPSDLIDLIFDPILWNKKQEPKP